jgi:hypothetical protein
LIPLCIWFGKLVGNLLGVLVGILPRRGMEGGSE